MSRHALSVIISLIITSLLIFIGLHCISDPQTRDTVKGGLVLGFPIIIIIFALIYVLALKKIGSSEQNPITSKIRIYLRNREYKKMPWICPDCDNSNSSDSLKCNCGNTYDEETHLKQAHQAARALKTVKLCTACNKEVPYTDQFCTYCGESIRTLSSKEKQEIKKASKWILAISIMFVIFGTIFGFIQQSQADKAYVNLSKYEDSDVLNEKINGKQYTVGELKAQIDKEVKITFFTNYLLAAIMFGLYIWSYRAPFPAMITALCIYLATIALNGIIDPKTLLQGIIIKIIFISALVAGIKASLVTRKLSTPV